MKVNKTNLKKLIDALEHGYDGPDVKPVFFQMREYCIPDMEESSCTGVYDFDGMYSARECGSAACLAGLSYLLRTGKPYKLAEWDARVQSSGSVYVNQSEAEWLGLTADQAVDLFVPWAHGKYEPEDFDYLKRNQAVEVLNHLMETGEIDWGLVIYTAPPEEYSET